jgi:hypothetical protein
MLSVLGDQHSRPSFAVAEILQLQICTISETLAIACLAAHGDVEGARSARLVAAYQANFIMNGDACGKSGGDIRRRAVKLIVAAWSRDRLNRDTSRLRFSRRIPRR